jgi:hypothetical protein
MKKPPDSMTLAAERDSDKMLRLLKKLGRVEQDIAALPADKREDYIFVVANSACLGLITLPAIQKALALALPGAIADERLERFSVAFAMLFAIDPAEFIERQRAHECKATRRRVN